MVTLIVGEIPIQFKIRVFQEFIRSLGSSVVSDRLMVDTLRRITNWEPP